MNGRASDSASHRVSLLAAVVVSAAVLLAMGRIVTHDFVLWDDPGTIVENPNFTPPTAAKIGSHWTEAKAGLYVPLTYTVWGLLALPDGPEPAVYHAASLLLHIASAWVVFQILFLLLARYGPALLGAILFAVHPVQVEPVSWASGLKDVLCGTLSMIALWQYLRFARSDSYDVPASPFRSSAYWMGLAALVLASLAKPTAVVVPLLAGVVDALMLRRPLRRIAWALAPWVLAVIPCAIWTKLVQSSVWTPHVPLWQRPLVAADALAFYAAKIVFPIELAIDYGRYPAYAFERGWPYYTWILPAALAVLLWIGRRRWPAALATALIFAIGLAPVLGFSRFMFQTYSTVADHYLYIPMLGPALLLAWLLCRYWRPAVIGGVAVLLTVLALRSALQSVHWQDDRALFTHTVAVNPRSWIGHNNLAYVRLLEGNLNEAVRHCEITLELQPLYFKAYDNLAKVYSMQGRLDAALQTLERMHERIERLPPEQWQAARPQWKQLAQVYLAHNRPADAAQALRKHLQRYPTDTDAAAMLERVAGADETPP